MQNNRRRCLLKQGCDGGGRHISPKNGRNKIYIYVLEKKKKYYI